MSLPLAAIFTNLSGYRHVVATPLLAELARAATFGQVDTVIIDMSAHVAGHIDIAGALVLDPADDLDALEEIARAALGPGARVMSVRSDDLPDGVSAAGLLRFATEG
ncbi:MULTISPECIES: hypothetical protein [Gordonia]|uniref:Uncharacterized protein n=1 Tax=Gordonia sputi NBRC 100414 TaxID=1089453 RepID=H5U4C0_9ACTN|nr:MULTISPECIES: hypothetical protein [Gordonia]NKY95249.1 hypothetical protein [Gordonia sputi]OBA34461.1 hypothetical protein A5766_10980 [Gordonia sp. 852002-51296_SCH5728562-b]GAB40578.1 hypothetical protein GOSPT_109_00310 [Gordonia sputi NBRC 100414]